MLRIVLDGAADLPQNWEHEYDLHILPLRVQFGDETYTQGDHFTNRDFYRLVREKKIIPKTSLPSIGQVAEFYRGIAQPGDTILSIHVTAKLSGTFATVKSAARELEDKFRVIVFDSAAGSVAQAFLAREARLLERAGASLEVIMARLEFIRSQTQIIFTLDTLEFAVLSGRINAIQSLFASALQVKPIIVLCEGMLDIAEKVRTRRRALDRVVERLVERLGSQPINLAVVHAEDPTTAQEMLKKVTCLLNAREAYLTDLSIPVAANLGPGAIGIIAYPLEEE